MTVAVELVGFTCAGLGLGYLAWTKGGFPSWVVVIGALFGLVIAMVRLKKTAEHLSRDDKRDPPRE